MTGDDILKNATVITLRKRPDRGAIFLSRFQTLTGRAPRIVYGFDGDRVPIPTGWQTTRGAFGCCLAHVAAQMRVLSDEEYSDDDPFAFFEDDAVFCDGFLDKLETVAKFVPNDWEILYLGGELLLTGRPKPTVVATRDGVKLTKPYNVNRLHAYVVRARALPKIAVRLLEYSTNAPKVQGPSGDETCFDYEVGRMQERGELTVYAVAPWLVGQGGYGSDTYPSDKGAFRTRFWQV